AIDGETQRIAWRYAAQEYPPAVGQRVKVVIHHGKDPIDARQGFYDLNTREVKPNAAVAIAMDSMDLATKITRRVMEESVVLENELQPERRAASVVSAPSILAGLGVLAHHAVPRPPRRDGVDSWSVEEIVAHLQGVNWDRTVSRETADGSIEKSSPWEGIAGK